MSIRWIDVPESLAEPLGDMPKLVEQGRATIVKDRPQRTVFRVHLSGLDLHVKQCKVRGWRARVRKWLRPPKAQLEYAKLLAAAARAVPTAQPIGCGVAQSESWLVTPTIADAVPLSERLEQPLDARARFTLAETLGRFMARVHNAGVLHPDSHPGNILIRDSAEPEIFLLDLHDARLGSAASERASIANLVLLNRWFILRTNRTDRLRFWRAYVGERAHLLGERRGISPTCQRVPLADSSGLRLDARLAIDYFAARDLERRTWVSNLRFWRTRVKRCVGENRRFQRISAGQLAGFAVRDCPDIVSLTQAVGGSVLKDSRSSMVAIRELGDQRHIVKHFHRSGRACRRSWINGHAFLDCLLPTPRPLAMVRRYHFGFPRDGYLITEFVPDAMNLRDAIVDASKRRVRIDLVARAIRDLHQRGWSHRDLKAANILLARNSAGEESPWFIDLAGASRPILLSRRRRAKDLARLNASFHDLPQLTRTDRLRFLRAYLTWNLHGPGDWKAWWRCVDRHTRGKVAKNRWRGRPLA